MNTLAPAAPQRWLRRGYWWIGAAGIGLWLLTLLLAVEAPLAAPLVPVVLLVVVLWGWLLVRHEPVSLGVVLVGFALVTGNDPGLQAGEVLFGLVLASFLPTWFVRRWMRGERVVYGGIEGCLLAFTCFAVLSGAWSMGLFGTKFLEYVGETSMVISVLMYFPIREWAGRSRSASAWLFGVMFWYGLYVAVRNAIAYQAALSNAEALWQLVMGRVALAELLLADAALAAAVLLVHAQRWKVRGVMLGMFGVCIAALVITQSRGYWVSTLLGLLVVFLLVNGRRRAVLMGSGFGSLLTMGLIAFAVAPEAVTVVAKGLGERFVSLGSAGTRDLSLVYRILESRYIADMALQNPILGYGIGAPFTIYRIIEDLTMRKLYVHNGYLSLWYHYGVLGVLPLLVWGRAIGRGIGLYRNRAADTLARLSGLTAAACLIAALLSAMTSSPVQLGEAWLHLGFWAGLVAGNGMRLRATPPQGERA